MEHSCRHSENGFVNNAHLSKAADPRGDNVQRSRFSIADIAQLHSTEDTDVNSSGLKLAGMEVLASGTSIAGELLKKVDRGRGVVSRALANVATLVQGQGARPKDSNTFLASR